MYKISSIAYLCVHVRLCIKKDTRFAASYIPYINIMKIVYCSLPTLFNIVWCLQIMFLISNYSFFFRLNNCCRYVLIFHITIWYNMRKTIIAYSSCLEEYPWAAERVKNTLMQNEQLNFKNIIKYETIPRK